MSLELSLEELIDAARVPGKDGLYFLGVYTQRITFFSQQVRALRLARALHQLEKIKNGQRIAVVGAGAAGATLAAALALLGYKVWLYDKSDDILHLQSGSSRLLHPHIYEWPRFGSLDDRAGLPILDWSAGAGDKVVPSLRDEFETLKAGLPNLIFKDGFELIKVEDAGSEWQLTFKGESNTPTFDHVFLTIGFGEELSCGPVKPEDYWKPGAVGTTSTEAVKGVSYVVSGNGDGALTVILSLLIKNFDHDVFTRDFLNFSKPERLREAADQVFAGKALDADVEAELRSTVLPVLLDYGVIDEVQGKLRTDRLVTMNTQGPLFAAGRASQLNQCMVLALLEAARAASIPIVRSRGFVTSCSKDDNGVRLTGTTISGASDNTTYNHAILRHGPDIKKRFAPAGSLIGLYETHIKALMVKNPNFGSPPALDDETYDLFETKRIERLTSSAMLGATLAAAAEQQRVIEIAIDDATNTLIERGCRLVRDIAEECEQLPARYFIDLHVRPEQLPHADDLIRLARCSDRKIELRSCVEVYADWTDLDTGMTKAPPRSSARHISGYSAATISQCVDGCLMRLLDQGVESAVGAGGAPGLGSISPEILERIEATWSEWRLVLNSDPKLRFDFLRWLANVDQRTAIPWNGDRAMHKNLVNALVLIAATHAGEELTPTSISNGNLTFAPDGVAIGTGCEAIGLQPLSSRSTPDDWGADALILAAANEVIVSDPAGTVMDGGKLSTSVTVARRVPPAIIQNDRRWQSRLAGPLSAWQQEIETEFQAWRARQDEELRRVAK